MNVKQISLMRDLFNKDDGSGNTLAFSSAVVFNNEISFVNTDHFVIFDDANELVSAILPNTDGPVTGAIAPYKISTGFYDNVQYMEGLFNMANFKTAVKTLFVDTGLIDEEKEKRIMNWANSIRNTVPDPDQVPYFDETPVIAATPPVAPPARVDGIYPANNRFSPTHKDNYGKQIRDIILSNKGDCDIRINTNNFMTIIANTPDNLIDTMLALIGAIGGIAGTRLVTLTTSFGVSTISANSNEEMVTKITNLNRDEIAKVCCNASNTASHIYLTTVINPSDNSGRIELKYNFAICSCRTKEVILDEFYKSWNSFVNGLPNMKDRVLTISDATDDLGMSTVLANTFGIKSIIVNNAVTLVTAENAEEKIKKALLNVFPDSNDDKPVNLSIQINCEDENNVIFKVIPPSFDVRYVNRGQKVTLPAPNADGLIVVNYPVDEGDLTVERDQKLTIIANQNINNLKLTNNGDLTIRGKGNIELNGGLVNNGRLTIDVEGTIVSPTEATIKNNDVLYINNGNFDALAHKKAVIENATDAVAHINGGYFTRSKEAGSSTTNSGGNSFYVIRNKGIMLIEDCVVYSEGKFSSLVCNIEGYLKISGGKFTNGFIVIKNDDFATLEIDGGEFKSLMNESVVQNWSDATIKNCTLDGRVSCWGWENGSSKTNIQNCRINDNMYIYAYDEHGVPSIYANKCTINGNVYSTGYGISSFENCDINGIVRNTNISTGVVNLINTSYEGLDGAGKISIVN